MIFTQLLPTALLAHLTIVSDPPPFRQRCLDFDPASAIPASTLARLEHVQAGTLIQLNDNHPSCNRPSQLVDIDICRIALQIPTSDRSHISFELWLPDPSIRGGNRYLATGNGGVDGCIKYEDLAYGVANGFTTMGTNNGHNGTSGKDFLNNPDVVEDFSHRALHVGTVTAKNLIELFHGQEPRYSYYIGCSLGGRMGIAAAERHPQDYDGIVAGAPAVDFNNLYSQRARFFPITGEQGDDDYISIDTWTGLIHDEVMRQCDDIDGVNDGIIEVANKCHFDPSTLLCRENQSDQCLNPEQVKQVERIYSPFTYPNGTLIFPRMNPGNELAAVKKLLAGKPFDYSVDWFRYVVYSDPDWDPATFTTADADASESLDPSSIKTWPLALPAFRDLGGKLLTYHGGQDNQITAFNTERFWDRMRNADDHLQDFHRFFRISGMNHCGGGPGAGRFGQGGNERTAFEREGNVLAAVAAWVEEGIAPETLTGTKFVEGEDGQLVEDFQRAHCLYPKEQTYKGGDPKAVSSWECR